MRRSLLLSLLLFVAVPAAVAQPTSTPAGLADRIAEVLGDDDFDDAFWGALVVDLETGRTLYAANEGRRFIPASNMKLVSTAAVLDALGPDFRYTTRLYADGTISNGTLLGSLVVRGSGDPTFGGRYTGGDLTLTFREWADSLSARGVRRVVGPVVGDDDAFDEMGLDGRLGKGWSWDDLVYGYAAEASGLQFGEGTVTVTTRGTVAGRPGEVSVSPDVGYVTLVNRTTTLPGGAVRDGYARELSSNVFTVTTAVPAGETADEALAIVNPTEFFVRTLVAVLQQRGIEVDGEAVDVDDWGQRPRYTTMTRIATHRSPPLASIVAVTNEESNNLYAEHLLRTVGAYQYGDDDLAPGSVAAGVAASEPFLRRMGVDPFSLTIADGSGLSNLNRLTPEAIIALLTGMHNHPNRRVWDAFYSSLPRGGYTGTLRSRYRAGDARGNVRAKTGFISGARTLSGYVTADNGHLLAFSLLCNHYSTSTARVNRAQDAIVELLADYNGR